MKNIWKSLLLGLVFVLILGIPGYSVTTKFLLGDVKLLRADQNMKVTSNTVFEDGDILMTGNNSYIILTTNNGDQIELKENSHLVIDLKLFESGSVSVIKGTISAKFNKLKKDKERKIFTPTAVAAVRGTEFTVTVADTGSTRVSMTEGSLDVYNPNGKINVSGKEKTDITPGDKPKSASKRSSDEKWVDQQNTELKSFPEKVASSYEKHIKSIKKDSDSKDNINNIKKNMKNMKDKKTAAKTGEAIDETEENLKDNMMMNKASAVAIDNIMSDYDNKKNTIFSKFEKLKSECDRVEEQQKKDLEAIQKIKEEYLKARKEIFDKHDSYVEQILNNTK